jgi:hypothetical protein
MFSTLVLAATDIIICTTADLQANSSKWFDDNVLRAIQKHNRPYSRHRVSRTPEGWERFCLLQNRASQIMRFAKRHFAGRFIDLSGNPKRLWRNIRSFGLMDGSSENVAYTFSADEFNAYFNTLRPQTLVHLTHLTFLIVSTYRVLMRCGLQHR